MTQVNPMEADLLFNARDRLTTWMKDTAWRCEAAGLPPEACISIIATCLSMKLGQIQEGFFKKGTVEKALKIVREESSQ